MQISSSLLENAVNEFSRLPGVGKKTALRLVLHLIKQSPEEVTRLTDALDKMKKELRFAKFVTISPITGCVIFAPTPCAGRRRYAWWRISGM